MYIWAALRRGGKCPPPWWLTPTLGLLTQKGQVERRYPPAQVINHGRRQALSWRPVERSTWHLVRISYCWNASGLKPFRKRSSPCPLFPSRLLSLSPAGNQVANIFRKQQLIPPSTVPRASNARPLYTGRFRWIPSVRLRSSWDLRRTEQRCCWVWPEWKKKTGRRPVTEFLPAKDIEKCEESFFKTYLVMDGFVPWSEPSVAFHCPFLSERVLSREYISRITHSKVSLVIPVTTRARP